MPSRFAAISSRRRAAWQDIETWSSWLALVGVESTERGFASALFSLISAADVTSAIISPEFRPGRGVRKAGRPKDSVGSTSSAMRRWAIEPISAMAMAIWSAASATGSPWKLPPETISSPITSGLSVTAFASISRVSGGGAEEVEAGAHHLRLAADAVGILHALVFIAMRLADRRAVEQRAQAGRRLDLARLAAERVDLGPEGRR